MCAAKTEAVGLILGCTVNGTHCVAYLSSDTVQLLRQAPTTLELLTAMRHGHWLDFTKVLTHTNSVCRKTTWSKQARRHPCQGQASSQITQAYPAQAPDLDKISNHTTAGPRLWNSLPSKLRQCYRFGEFKGLLKTRLSWCLWHRALFRNHLTSTYLLISLQFRPMYLGATIF